MTDERLEKKYDVLALGEVMLRLSPEGNERIAYSESFDKRIGGSELNVVSGICMLGCSGGIITKLPKNEIGKFVAGKIRHSGAGDELVAFDSRPEARLGIYYCESGAHPRKAMVVYDRRGSSFTSLAMDEIPESAYLDTRIFHTSGITVALGEAIRETTLNMMESFRRGGALISFDVNYRSTLWSEQEAREVVLRILPLVDILFISEETCRRMLSMSGSLKDIHKQLASKYPNLKLIASTRRAVSSPKLHDFDSLIYDCKAGEHFEEEAYKDIEVVDRIGSGDAYVAGVLFALCRFRSSEQMVRYGNAMAALKNTTIGDMPNCDLSDVERVISNHLSDGPASEMVR